MIWLVSVSPVERMSSAEITSIATGASSTVRSVARDPMTTEGSRLSTIDSSAKSRVTVSPALIVTLSNLVAKPMRATRTA
jgi:hypothetical protein